MTDGIATGWHHAVWLLGWLVGALGPLVAIVLVIAGLAWLEMALSVDIPHYARVRRIRRQTRRAGRRTS